MAGCSAIGWGRAVGTPVAHDIRSGIPPGPITMAASPMAYPSGCETERRSCAADGNGRKQVVRLLRDDEPAVAPVPDWMAST